MKRLAFAVIAALSGCGARPGPDAHAEVPSTAAAPAPSSSVGRYAQVHGLRMYYEVQGEGPVLVILHGGTSTVSVWPGAEGMAFFARSFKVIAPEQMGHGHTADDPGRPFHVRSMADDTLELLRQLGVSSASFLGWSDGADVALDIAATHPGLVKDLVVSGAPVHPASADPGAMAWLQHVKAECAAGDKPGRDCWPPNIHDAYLRDAPDPAHWPAFLERVKTMWIAEPELRKEDLAKITARTLIIAGDHDSSSLRDTTGLFGDIAGAAMWIVPESDHFVPIRRAKLFDETVAAFLSEGDAAGAPH